MRHALVALSIAAVAALMIWWGRGEEHARAAAPDAPSDREETGPDPAPAETAPEPEAMAPPPDPPQRGECALFLRVLDAESRQPVASTVNLWRLDAPGNERWTAGDQLQLTTEVPAEGARIEALPVGFYRPVCLAERFSADDPPPVLVEGPLTEVTIRILVPRKFHAYVRVVDARGEPVPGGSVREDSRMWRKRGDPAWREPRSPRDAKPGVEHWLFFGGGSFTRPSGSKMRPQPPEGFCLGPFTEDSKESEVTHTASVCVEGSNDVRVFVPGSSADGSTFLGLAVPLATVPGDLRMQDGRTLPEAGGKVHVSFTAVRVDASATAPLLSDTPFHVEVSVPGYKLFAFEHRLGEPPRSLALERAVEPLERDAGED